VAELHVLDALRREQSQRACRPADLAFAGPDCQARGDFQTALKSDDALDIRTILGAEGCLDIASDLVQRRREGLDVGLAQVRILSYFGDGNGASHPN
jgi:hypothetical protein